jgi:hypothetical protein
VIVPVSDGSIASRPTLEVGAADGVVVLVELAEQPARARAPTSATAAMLPERVIFTVFPSGMWGFVLVDPGTSRKRRYERRVSTLGVLGKRTVN